MSLQGIRRSYFWKSQYRSTCVSHILRNGHVCAYVWDMRLDEPFTWSRKGLIQGINEVVLVAFVQSLILLVYEGRHSCEYCKRGVNHTLTDWAHAKLYLWFAKPLLYLIDFLTVSYVFKASFDMPDATWVSIPTVHDFDYCRSNIESAIQL